METPRSLASSALTHPACRYTEAPNQITILRGNNEAWFLVNSIADKTRIHAVYIRIYVYVARRDGTRRVCRAESIIEVTSTFVFSRFLPTFSTRRNCALERAQSPPAYPFFHIAEYKLCYRLILISKPRSRSITYICASTCVSNARRQSIFESKFEFERNSVRSRWDRRFSSLEYLPYARRHG